MSRYDRELVSNVAGNKYGKGLVRTIYKAICKQVVEDVLSGKRVNAFGVCRLKLVNAKRNNYINPRTMKRFSANRKRLKYEMNAAFRRTVGGLNGNKR